MDNSLGVIIHRTFAADCKAAEKDAYTFEATITTASLDRYNEVIVPSGVDMEAFKKNPVVFWGHNYDGFPIAKAIEVMPDSAAIRARFTFPPEGIYQQADIARKLLTNHFINAVSVGIIPLERSDDGKTITKSELLEFSLVGVPANRDALLNSYERLHLSGFTDAEIKGFGIELPDVKGAVPYQNLPLAPDDMKWDAVAADGRVAKWAGGPDKDAIDWGKYKKAFLWFDSEHADTYGAYKLGIGDIVGGNLQAVPRGIMAVAAVLMGARGGVDIPDGDKETVKNQVSKYYKKMGKTAPWDKSFDEIDIKEGRVLSKRTRDLLNNAVKQMEEAAQAIQDLLDATSTEEDGDKSAPGDVQSANDLLDQVSLLAAFYKP